MRKEISEFWRDAEGVRWLVGFIIGAYFLGLLAAALPASAQIVTSSGVWRREGSAMLLNPSTLTVGAVANPIQAGYFTNLTVTSCTGCGGDVWPLDSATNFATSTTATTTVEWFKTGVFASSTSQFVDANIWGVLNLKATTSSLLATDSSGNVIATTSVGTNLLTGALTTINGTTINAAGTHTITAASSSLLSDNNTWSGTNVFSGNATFTRATTTGFAITSLTNSILSTNANGSVVASTSIGWNLIKGPASSIFAFDASGNPTATTSIGVNYLSGILPIAQGGTATGTQVTNGVNYFDGTRITSGTTLTFDGTNLGVGTTTPFWNLTVASSTGPQLALTDGTASSNAWTLRSISNSLYIATSTYSATSSTAALRIDTNGKVTANCFTNDGSTCITGGSGGTPGGSASELQYRAGASTFGAITGSAGFGYNLGIASTTPWALLSIATSTASYTANGMASLLAVATSTDPTGVIFNVFATTSVLAENGPNKFDSGARVSIGTLQTNNSYPGLLDQLTVNGRINTGDWLYYQCQVDNVLGAAKHACGDFSFNIQTTGNVGTDSGGGFSAMKIQGSNTASQAANSASGLFLWSGVTGQFFPATSTIVAEAVFRIGLIENATSSVYIFGATNRSDGGGALHSEPTAGCYFVASSTSANWWLVARNTSAPGTMVDTGVASSSVLTGTGAYYRFRIEASKGACDGYIQTPTMSLTKVAHITTNTPTSNGLQPVQLYQAALNGKRINVMSVVYLRAWIRLPALFGG